MHRRIVESIKYIIENSVINKFTAIDIIPQRTDGFWKMLVVTTNENYVENIREVATQIGRINGENLCFKVKKLKDEHKIYIDWEDIK